MPWASFWAGPGGEVDDWPVCAPSRLFCSTACPLSSPAGSAAAPLLCSRFASFGCRRSSLPPFPPAPTAAVRPLRSATLRHSPVPRQPKPAPRHFGRRGLMTGPRSLLLIPPRPPRRASLRWVHQPRLAVKPASQLPALSTAEMSAGMCGLVSSLAAGRPRSASPPASSTTRLPCSLVNASGPLSVFAEGRDFGRPFC